MEISFNSRRIRSLAMAALAGATLSTGVGAQVRQPEKMFEAPQVPLGTDFTYQGRLTDGGVPYNGPADLEFRLFDASGGGIQIGADNLFPAHSVNDGLFTVELDFGLGAFNTNERWLEITVNGVPLSPRQLVHPGPIAQYALTADGAAITNIDAANISSGTLPDSRLAGKYSNLLNFNNTGNTYTGTSLAIESDTLYANGSAVGIGTNTPVGKLNVSGGDLVVNSSSSAISLKFNSTGTGWRFATTGGGSTLLLRESPSAGSDTTRVTFNAGGNVDFDGDLAIGNALTLSGTTSGYAEFRQSDGDQGVVINGSSGTVQTYGSDGLLNTRMWNGAYGELDLWDGSVTNDLTVILSATSDSGGQLTLRDNTAAFDNFFADGDGAYGGADLHLREDDGTDTIIMRGSETFGTGGEILGYNSAGGQTIDIDTDDGGRGFMQILDGASTTNNRVRAWATSSGGLIQLTNSTGATTITLDAETGGDGRITTQEIAITGGSDLSEQFDVAIPESGVVEPGMVVCIDPDQIGRLLMSSKAYDRTVAGIVSGAGGIETGMMMGQEGSIANGDHPIALAGRVYVWCDTSNGPIVPGDLLTTSDTPGHAMKVANHERAQGAIIGKAMSRLDAEEGSGLVLVLVSLQ